MDYDHLEVMGYTMVEGRFFSRDFPSDTLAVVLNEAAMRKLGYTTMEGKTLGVPGNADFSFQVIGVMKDFNFESLKSSIRPMVMVLGPSPNWDIAVRLTPGDVARKIELLGTLWKKYVPEAPYEYSFVDQNFNAKFHAEQQLSNVILVFTGLAIFIACLGLFGLATFTAEQRSKEIGIRKVLGASVAQVVLLLSRDFTRLIIVSFVIAIPLTWYGMNQWLEGFAYRINFSATVAIVAGVTAFALAMLTVSFQSLKAAVQNPVKALKSD
jgi:putative ABC transport system permease protein